MKLYGNYKTWYLEDESIEKEANTEEEESKDGKSNEIYILRVGFMFPVDGSSVIKQTHVKIFSRKWKKSRGKQNNGGGSAIVECVHRCFVTILGLDQGARRSR